jgi:Arc/MetJ family transcription regulator
VHTDLVRTTLNLDDNLMRAAQQATGVAGKTALVELGLRALVESSARRRLAALQGKIPGLKAPARRRPPHAKRK